MARSSGLQQQPRVSSSQHGAEQEMADGGSSKRSGSQTALSLLFSLESGDVAEKLSSNVSDGRNDYDPITEVQRIQSTVAALSHSECKLAQAVGEAKASSILNSGSVQLAHVGSYLRSRHGYLVAIRHANVIKRPRAYLRMLQHTYLVVRGLEGLEGVDVLVDLNFRDHFVLPHSTCWYAKLLAALPHDWVGTAAALAPVVGLMSAGMRLCFKQAGVPLPPWREARAVLSRWLPDAYEEEPPPLVPLPDGALRRMLAPYHGAPFRSALQRAAASELQTTAAAALDRAAVAGDFQAMTVYDQQQLASSGRPPLPRASGVKLVTPSVKAAAADAAAGAQQPAVAGAGHSHHGHLPAVPDVPRKIILGFPDQDVLPAATSKRITAAAAAAGAAAAAALQDGHGVARQVDADAGVLVIKHQQQVGSNQQCVLVARAAKQQQKPAACCSVSALAVQQQQAGETTVRKGRPAGGLVALQQPEAVAVGCSSSDAAAGCAAAAFQPPCSSAAVQAAQPSTNQAAAARALQQKPCEQKKQKGLHLVPAHALPRPAFTSAVGDVQATGSSTFPAVVANKQLLRQQQDSQPSSKQRQQQQQQQQQEQLQAVDTSSGAVLANSPSTAAASACINSNRLRQFKTLDQLLPRMTTIRLGAA